MQETTGLYFLCSYCRTELNEEQIFDFRGAVGCENCIKDYYRNSPEEVASQLSTRRRKAVVWLARNRKTLEKQAKKAAPGVKPGASPVA